ncbi:uncharacterized protein LOC129907504 [Episyrphus balteatus]|uniref:uncharacterized protein LOC129907504 n=1 Tax=Episyrphus balteatus TaxID=286459 RepID=UPI002486C979|nr:uncharacterized protein LOC129907504 [Episyrphus balteatus]
MIRDVSTSTIGREDRKPAMDAYMFQRRVLLVCSFMMILSLIVWIIAISTDRWIIISGNGGIYIPETRRFFMYSHSGLWRHCRITQLPNALKNATVARNFTSIAYQSPASVNDAKFNITDVEFVKSFLTHEVTFPLQNFTDAAKERMFAHWIRNEQELFQEFKKAFWSLELANEKIALTPIDSKPIQVNPLDVPGLEAQKVFGQALQQVVVDNLTYFFVIPIPAQRAMFNGWNEKRLVPKLYWPYVRDLDIPAYVMNEHRVILQLIPPKPPKKGGIKNGYDYIYTSRCKYIEMFPSASSLKMDPGFDDELMDYIRTQASFACITVFVMCLGTVFTFYTFMNPRYMFKRLAGGIHLVSASTCLVVIQVLMSSVEYTKEHLFYAYPDGAELTYGYGVWFAWFTFITNVVCGLLFMWYSGKKKGSKAPTDELAMADEATIMGR